MKTFSPNILLVDSDPRTLGAIQNSLTVVTDRTHVLKDASAIEEVLRDFRPEVAFINFNMDQRRRGLELKDELLLSKPDLDCFAYADAADPILVAHVLELGFRDIFVRPFDPDVICTKINRLGSSKHTNGHDLFYSPIKPARPAELSVPMRLLSIDEGGFYFRSKSFIAKGVSFTFSGSLCQEIFGQRDLELMVSSSERDLGANVFTYYAEPKTPSKIHQSALRHFLLSKTSHE